MLIKETLDKFYQTINTGFKVIKGEKSDCDTLITITQCVHNYYNLQQWSVHMNYTISLVFCFNTDAARMNLKYWINEHRK